MSNKSAQSNLGTGPRRGRLSGPCAVQHCAVACIHEYASCPSAAAAAVSAPRVASFCCVHLRFGRRIATFLLISHKPRRWSWNRIYRQKAHESSFSMIRLPNGNVVKFWYTNRKHFTVGDPMAFPIVKMGKNPKPPLPLHDVDPHVIQQCIGPPHAPPKTVAPTVEALPHTYTVNSTLVTMSRPKFAPKSTPSSGHIQKPNHLPHPCIRPIYDAKRHQDPICLFPQCTGQTDRPTDRRESLMTIVRSASNESYAAYTNKRSTYSNLWIWWNWASSLWNICRGRRHCVSTKTYSKFTNRLPSISAQCFDVLLKTFTLRLQRVGEHCKRHQRGRGRPQTSNKNSSNDNHNPHLNNTKRCVYKYLHKFI